MTVADDSKPVLMLPAARWWASKGIPVFPLHNPVLTPMLEWACSCEREDCHSPAKHPRTTNGLHDASTDPATITAWWERWPEANIGLRTGVTFDLLDIDGPAGFEALARIEAQVGAPLALCVVESGRADGGRHYYLAPPALGALQGGKTSPVGVDVKSEGGYVVAPPSQHITGYRYTMTHPYAVREDSNWTEIRAWLVEQAPKRPTVPPPPLTVERSERGEGWQRRASAWCRRALDGVANELAGMPDRSGRNTYLNDQGWRLLSYAAAGHLDTGEVLDVMRQAALDSGLSVTETDQTLRSAVNGAEKKGPLDPPISEDRDTPVEPPATPPSGAPVQPGERRLKLTRASDIGIRPVHWIWTDRLPMGTLALIAGREGIGKSTVAYQLAADITRGTLPGRFEGTPKAVIVAATEDSWAHTIVPRLMAAKADLSMVYRVDVVTKDDVELSLTLPKDVEALTLAVRQYDAGMVLLDPLMSRLDAALDSHKDADTRQALEPITKMADQTNTLIVGLIHVNKSAGSDPLTLIMGSRAFSAVARAVLFVMKDPDDESVRLLGQEKNNLGRVDLPVLTFRIDSELVAQTDEGPVWTGRVNWLGESERSIRDAITASAEDGDVRSSVTEAGDWLSDYLVTQGGAADSSDVKREGLKAGHSADALKKARRKLGLLCVAEGFPRKTIWRSPFGGDGE